ncbi:hypothetical protein CASFOL_027754 [Castilleja foliolosa]|uniref:F-box domain-containing protein n=1 Tax=Castilleja foliolosa TaxID=1961234 RepID=A0ABD3CFQ5_9LAMI
MDPKRIRKNSESPAAGAMADCILPEDIMLCILTRLPVKSIHRFKSVCKPLREVFSSPDFAKMHRAQFPLNPENQSVVIYGRKYNYDHTISLLKIQSDEEKKPTKLAIPSHQMSYHAEFIGCCNGLLCMAIPHLGELIDLWNPALNNMSIHLPLPNLKVTDEEWVSIGFGYNEEADDFKVIRIVDLARNKKKIRIGVEVYSGNSDSWSTIDVGFHFTVTVKRNEAIVNGNPYWIANVEDKPVLVCFDVREMVFKIVPLPYRIFKEVDDWLFADWKGDLGALVCNNKNGERAFSIDVLVFDDVGNIGWTKNHRFEPIELRIYRVLQCSKNGKILVGECFHDEKVFVFDTENGGFEEIVIDGTLNVSFQIYGYTESLAYIEGMEPLKH